MTEFTKIKQPEWIAHQPFGQMPYLEDKEAGLEIFESRAISRCESLVLSSVLCPLPSAL